MFALSCKIKIGGVSFTSVNEVKINRSIHNLGDTAVISVPLSARLKQSDQVTAVETAKQFKRGDKVEISLGYNNKLQREFVGFVKQLNYKRPLEIECEDWVFPLRSISIQDSWKSISLKDLLSYVAGKAGFKVVTTVPDITIEKFTSPDKTALWILQEIKQKYGLAIYFNQDNELYCGLLYGNTGSTVKYNFDLNVIDAGDLKWVDENDIKLKVKAISYEKSGKRIEASVGDNNGEVRTLNFYDVKDKTQLEKLAKAEIEKYKYTGYRGNIKTFLEPFAEPCMIADITDPRFNDRSGKYYIEGVEITFGQSGARRKVDIGIKLNK
jgi:hypothetical protein